MTTEEKNNFYKQDKKEYILNYKEIVLKWMNEEDELRKSHIFNTINCMDFKSLLTNPKKKIYEEIKDIKDLEKIIDYIVAWYEIKYPDCEFNVDNLYEYRSLGYLSSNMNNIELFKRLDKTIMDLIKCDYRSETYSFCPILVDGETIWNFSMNLRIKIKSRHDYMKEEQNVLLHADYERGIVALETYERHILKGIIDDKYLEKGYIGLLDLYNELMKSDKCISAKDIMDSVLDRELRIVIRKHLFELIALKLLYSKNTIPEFGHRRAELFIDEFNESLKIDLKTDVIDEIMSKDYKKVKKLVK